MAIVAPGAAWRPLSRTRSTRPLVYNIINVHTMVGTLSGCESWFSADGRPYSHFGLGGSGALWQWQDLAYRAASDLEGNPYSISIETEDRGALFPAWSGSDVPHWTEAQVDKLVELLAWLCVRFDIPPIVVPDSILGRRGGSYHRKGIDPWRVATGLLYSNAYAKACPGDRRIWQFENIVVPRVAALVWGVIKPEPKEWDEMATREEVRAEAKAGAREALKEALTTGGSAERIALRELAGMGVRDEQTQPYYLATDDVEGGIWVVQADHTGKYRVPGDLWNWLQMLHSLAGKSTSRVSVPHAVMSQIPTIT